MIYRYVDEYKYLWAFTTTRVNQNERIALQILGNLNQISIHKLSNNKFDYLRKMVVI